MIGRVVPETKDHGVIDLRSTINALRETPGRKGAKTQSS
jgi:hypothetical protein